MSTPPSKNRPGAPQAPAGQTGRATRRREPLFPLEDEDIAPRRRPPQPLGDLVGDLEDPIPARDRTPLPTRARPRPAREEPPPPPRRPLPEAAPARERAPAPREVATGDRQRRPAPELRPAPSGAARVAAVAEGLRQARDAYDETSGDLARAEMLRPPFPAYRGPLPPQSTTPNWAVLTVIAVASLLVIMTLGRAGGESVTSRFGMLLRGGEQPAAAASVLAGPANAVGDYRLQGAPSVSVETIDRILESYGSPAAGTGAVWYNLGLEYGIDPAIAVAFFIHESTAGTARNWAGLKPDGSTTHNVGNIICAGYPTCYNRFRDYPSWEAGIEDWYRLIDVEYIDGRGHQTVADVLPVYAPAFENNVELYINTVHQLVDQWRRGEVP